MVCGCDKSFVQRREHLQLIGRDVWPWASHVTMTSHGVIAAAAAVAADARTADDSSSRVKNDIMFPISDDLKAVLGGSISTRQQNAASHSWHVPSKFYQVLSAGQLSFNALIVKARSSSDVSVTIRWRCWRVLCAFGCNWCENRQNHRWTKTKCTGWAKKVKPRIHGHNSVRS